MNQIMSSSANNPLMLKFRSHQQSIQAEIHNIPPKSINNSRFNGTGTNCFKVINFYLEIDVARGNQIVQFSPKKKPAGQAVVAARREDIFPRIEPWSLPSVVRCCCCIYPQNVAWATLVVRWVVPDRFKLLLLFCAFWVLAVGCWQAECLLCGAVVPLMPIIIDGALKSLFLSASVGCRNLLRSFE